MATITLGHVADEIVNWIDFLKAHHNMPYDIKFWGWDWLSTNKAKARKINLKFEVSVQPEKQWFELWLPNTVFIPNVELAIDRSARIPINKFKDEVVIQLRIMYLILRAYEIVTDSYAVRQKENNEFFAFDIDSEGYPTTKIVEKD